MRKKVLCLTILITIAAGMISGCTDNERAKHFGGEMTIELEPGEKLEEATWKDDSLWYMTRPMREDEEPETHVFKEDSSMGIFEGTVTIIESK